MSSRSNPPVPKSRRRLVMIAMVIGVAAALAFFALRSSPYLQYIPWMPRQLGIWADSNGIVRNVAAFFTLALLTFVFVGWRWRHVLGLCVFGAALEVSQLWIRGRVFDWRDIVASMAGVALAWPLAWLLRRAWPGRRQGR